MTRTVDVGTMLKTLSGMTDTKDLNSWENLFVKSCMETSKQGTLTAHLSGAQVDVIDRIYRKHAA